MTIYLNTFLGLVLFSSVVHSAKLIGCYSDISLTARLFPYHRKDYPGTLQPRVCVDHCLKNGMSYAGLQYGRECFCSDERPPYTSIAAETDCDMRCEGDNSQMCGGSFRLSVYDTLGQDGNHEISKRINCYEDSDENRLLPDKKWEFSKLLTPELCIGHCWRNGYRYAGLRSGKECHCGDTLPNRAVIYSYQCNTPCIGDKTINCGGYFQIDVYHTGIPDYSEEENLVGCFSDDHEIRLLSGGSFKLAENNTPRRCMNLCYSLGYRYSGVEYRVECFCGNRKPPTNREVGENECQGRCPRNDNDFCGGDFRLLVYKTGKGSSQQKPTSTNPPYSLTTIQQQSTRRYSTQSPVVTPTHLPHGIVTDQVNLRPSYTSTTFPRPIISEDNSSSVLSLTIESRPSSCKFSESTVNGKSVCQGSIIFSENFNKNFNRQKWFHNVFMPNTPDYEFVVFTKSTLNSYVKNGRLYIAPTILMDDAMVRTGKLTLPDCTGESHTDECERQAVAFNFLPPIESARITTENFISFKYGRVDITAKLPSGDWIVPELWLEPKKKVYGAEYASGRIRIASVRGNADLTLGNRQIGARVLECGVLVGQGDFIRGRSVFRNSSRLWTHDFHTFTVIWTPSNISFMVDGSERQGLMRYGDKLVDLIGFTNSDWISSSFSPIAPFDQEFYLSIGLSVGGMRNFPDGCISDGHNKPWKNMGVKALANFYQDKAFWHRTWRHESSVLQVDSIKVTAL